MDSDEYKLEGKVESGHTTPGLNNEPSKLFTWTRAYMLVLHLLLVILAIALTIVSDPDGRRSLENQRSWSPAQEFVEYEINGQHATNHTKYTKYSGYPTPDQDEAWRQLMKPMFFNASFEELRRSGESLEGLAAVEEGGYSATIGVYHELHCLRQLRFFLFQKRYYPNMTRAQELYLYGHLDHCIETLRLTVMCHGNTGIYSFAWHDLDAPKPATQSSSRSVCAKWSSIENWARSRSPPNLTVEAPGQDGVTVSGEAVMPEIQ